MAVGPSGGMLKRMFDPANVKKKMKNALGFAKSGGNSAQSDTTPRGTPAPKKPMFVGRGRKTAGDSSY